jgi:hypothetical protein
MDAIRASRACGLNYARLAVIKATWTLIGAQRRGLAAKARTLGRRVVKDIATIARPDFLG